jgi:hypothetical protein
LLRLQASIFSFWRERIFSLLAHFPDCWQTAFLWSWTVSCTMEPTTRPLLYSMPNLPIPPVA